MTDLPKLVLKNGHDRRLRSGAPWVFANEVEMTDEVRRLPSGTVVRLALPGGRLFGLAHVNTHALIVARLLTRNTDTAVDAAFFERRFARARALRERFLPGGYYRLIHGEGDGLPGLVVDRYGEAVVVQANSAGMDCAIEAVTEGLHRALAPKAVVVRRDSRARALEGLAQEAADVRGELEPSIEVREADLVFFADPLRGQKTGWFFDQRPNRQFVRSMASGLRVLDLYAHTGGFALQALAGGAAYALAVDRSAAALDLAARAAAGAGLAERFETETGEVFDALARLVSAKQRFDLVIADPPPFAPVKKDVPAALRGYRKLARAAAGVVAAEGFLAIASCSHHVTNEALAQTAFQGVKDAGRGARLLFDGGAGPDHPLHPALPESRYLAFLMLALD